MDYKLGARLYSIVDIEDMMDNLKQQVLVIQYIFENTYDISSKCYVVKRKRKSELTRTKSLRQIE